jgi:hypothetical protein
METVPRVKGRPATVASSRGVVGFSMLAEPLRKQYATLSVWRDVAAVEAFIEARPHARLMTDVVPAMGTTRFVRWTISGADGLPSWIDAFSRLR